jgi:hypothetical protein
MDKAGNVTLIDYTQAPAYVWQDHIIQREFVPDPNFVLSLHDCEFYQFLKCIAGEHEAPAHAPAEDIPRTNYALRVFGYLCDTVKDPTRPWCIVLSEETADDNKGGGTGKGVFMRGVSHAAPVCFIDGKGMKPEDPELFSRVEPFITRVAFIDDAQKKFSIEVLNNAISDTFVMRRLYKGQTAIPYSDSPKVAVSTNYAVDTEANHAARRVRQFEFSPTFGPRFTPSDYFGHLLFSDWDNDEWNRFFNLVFYAVGAYRRHPQGLEDRPPSPNAAIKQALIRYGRDFVEWIHAVRPEYAGKEIARQKAYEDFQAYTGATEKDFGARKFYEAMRTTAAKLGLAFSEVRTNSVRTYKFYEVE